MHTQRTTTSRRLALAAMALALGGCSLVPPLPETAPGIGEAYPSTLATTGAATADTSWEDFVTESRLRNIVRLTLDNNRDLRAAVLKVEQSQAQYRMSNSARWPVVDASVALSRQQTAHGTTESWSIGPAVSAFELDLVGRVRSAASQADEQYLATVESRKAAQLSLVAEVTNQYLALRLAQSQRRIAEDALATVTSSHELNQAKFSAGTSSQLDLSTSEGQVLTSRINVQAYMLAEEQARNALVFLAGGPLDDVGGEARPISELSILAPIGADLPSELAARRPDILRAEHSLRAANANVGVVRAAFFPSIRLTTSLSTSSPDLSGLLGSGTGMLSFSPQVSLPIFNSGRNRANLRAAQIGVEIEVAAYEKAVQSAFREVADALAAASSYASQVQLRSALADAQQLRFALVNARYVQGEEAYLSVLVSQQDLYGAQQGLLQAQFNILANRIALYKALGGGWK